MKEFSWYLFDIDSKEKIDLATITELTIGGAASNGLVVSDGSVTAKHAKIIRKENNFFVQALNSFSPTFVNGKELKPEINTRLKVQDVVRLGQKIYFFSSTEPNKGVIELSSTTGTFKMNAQKTEDLIIHNYEEPVLEVDQVNKKTASLKSLRQQKEELEKLQSELSQLKDHKQIRDKKRTYFNNRLKELREFNSYLKAKKYNAIAQVQATIESIYQVDERLDQDIAKLQAEMDELRKEKKTNTAIINELTADIEIIKGRDNLKRELQALQKEINSWKEEGLSQKLLFAAELVEEKEKEFKEVQENYAQSRFGKKKKAA